MRIKLNLIVACSVFFAWNNVFAQQNLNQTFTFQAIYRMTYKPDSNNLNNVKSEDMELLTNDSISLFRSVNAGIADSAAFLPYQKKDLAAVMKIVSANRSAFHYSIVKTQRDILYTEEILSSDMIASYKEPKNEMHWEISSDTLTINGLHCQKAVLTAFGHRNWVAWFCNDIPISDGPYKFCGLPGIIVKISDEKEYWRFTLTGTSNKQTTVLINYDKGLPYVNMDKPTFFKKKTYFLFNAYEIGEARGTYKSVDPQLKENAKMRLAKKAKDDNNWIELP